MTNITSFCEKNGQKVGIKGIYFSIIKVINNKPINGKML